LKVLKNSSIYVNYNAATLGLRQFKFAAGAKKNKFLSVFISATETELLFNSR
jgi:hypothetical protein